MVYSIALAIFWIFFVFVLNPNSALSKDQVELATAKIVVKNLKTNLEEMTGSGVVISPDGYILTAAHLLDIYHSYPKDYKIYVRRPRLDGSMGSENVANFIDQNENVDLALIKTGGKSLHYLFIGDPQLLDSTEFLTAYGYGGGEQIINKTGTFSGSKKLFWEMDVPISEGFSGGPITKSGCNVLLGLAAGVLTSSEGNEYSGRFQFVPIQHAGDLVTQAGVTFQKIKCDFSSNLEMKNCPSVERTPRAANPLLISNRETEIEKIKNYLIKDKVVGIYSLGGLGTKEVANEVARQLLKEGYYRDGVINIKARGRDLSFVYDDIASAFCKSEIKNLGDVGKKRHSVLNLLKDKNVILIIDGLLDNRMLEIIANTLKGESIIFTTGFRPHSFTVKFETINLEKFSSNESKRFLERWIMSEQPPINQSTLNLISDKLGGNQYVLMLAVKSMKEFNWTPEMFLYELERSGISALGRGRDSFENIFVKLLEKIQKGTEQSDLVKGFEVIGLFGPLGFSQNLFLKIADVNEGENLLLALTKFLILEKLPNEEFIVRNPILSDIAQKGLINQAKIPFYLGRMVQYYATFEEKSNLIKLSRVDAKNAKFALDWAVDENLWDSAIKIIDLLIQWNEIRGSWAEGIRLSQKGQEISTIRNSLKDYSLFLRREASLRIGKKDLNNLRKAEELIKSSMMLERHNREPKNKGFTHYLLGRTYTEMSKFDEANHHLLTAKFLFMPNDHLMNSQVYAGFGALKAKMAIEKKPENTPFKRMLELSRSDFAEALESIKKLGKDDKVLHEGDKGEIYYNLSVIDRMLNNFEKAQENILKAIEIHQRTENLPGLASSLTELGIQKILQRKDSNRDAYKYLTNGIEIFKNLCATSHIARPLAWLAILDLEAKKFDEAIIKTKQVLDIFSSGLIADEMVSILEPMVEAFNNHSRVFVALKIIRFLDNAYKGKYSVRSKFPYLNYLQILFDQIKDVDGVLVLDVDEGSNGEKNGIMIFDYAISYGGIGIKSQEELVAVVKNTENQKLENEVVVLEIMRLENQKVKNIELSLSPGSIGIGVADKKYMLFLENGRRTEWCGSDN